MFWAQLTSRDYIRAEGDFPKEIDSWQDHEEVERNIKTEITLEEQSEKAESCQENYVVKYSWKGHKVRNRHKNRIKRNGPLPKSWGRKQSTDKPPDSFSSSNDIQDQCLIVMDIRVCKENGVADFFFFLRREIEESMLPRKRSAAVCGAASRQLGALMAGDLQLTRKITS